MINGIINVYKEPGFTSHDVVAKLRGITKQKKIGHTGTLDPDAEGVLLVCLGAATRVCDMLTDETKEYEAELRLGITTDTQDMSGEILREGSVDGLDEERIRECIMGFVGDIDQIPPMYSAIKVGGKKLYELARAGREVERKPRRITIYEIEIKSISLPVVTMMVKCSKGTYIRTLCNDIGERLGCGGAMQHLTRTEVGRFGIDTSHRLAEIEGLMKAEQLKEVLFPVTKVFEDLPSAQVKDQAIKAAQNGNMLKAGDLKIMDPVVNTKENENRVELSNITGSEGTISLHNNEQILVFGKNAFLYGVYEYRSKESVFAPVKMFFC
ncbi:MAG: tRNA pseudouridine(55) synthase TruB [Lachnospiraceae bacterium]|nr:tRNA pseudouridine(55) synthase TruB [Lachnospiraceae bacterium]